MKKVFAVVSGMVMAMTVLAGCGSGTSSQGTSQSSMGGEGASSGQTASADKFATSLQDIKDKGTLVIGLDDTFAPMGFRDEKGELVGFDIDLATAVCEELGVKAEFKPIDWSAKELELSSGRIDCIWNGMSITPEREDAMSLSEPYLNNKIIVMTNPDITVANKEALADYKIGVQAGSAALEALQSSEIYDSIKGNITEYPTYDEVIMDMNAKRLDCMVIDEVFGNYKNSKLDNKFGTAPFDFGDDLYGIGFRKSDAELAEAVSEAITTLVENGEAVTISETWFGTDITIK